MHRLPNFVVVLGLILFVSGGAAWYQASDATGFAPLPTIPETTASSKPRAVDQETIDDWSAPWSQPPVARPVAKPIEAPTLVVAPPPPRPDTTTLRLVGSMTGENGKIYLFKNAQSGTILTLSVDADSGAWQLKSIEDHKFVIQGPGGLYEVAR